MNRKDINELLDRLDYWAAKEKKFASLCENISPAYSPIVIEINFAKSFIDGVSQIHPEIRDCLMLYTNDIYSFRKYNAKNRDEFVTYLKRVMTSDE
jgi:hypothetical protein